MNTALKGLSEVSRTPPIFPDAASLGRPEPSTKGLRCDVSYRRHQQQADSVVHTFWEDLLGDC